MPLIVLFGPIIRLMMRACFREITSTSTWSSYVRPGREARELFWWLENMKPINGFPNKLNPSVVVFQNKFTGNASDVRAFLYLCYVMFI